MPKRKADAAVMEADGGNTSKKKKADKKADKGMEKQKEVKADKKGRERDGGYSTQQKSAISQFMNFTSTDRNTAIRHLKSSGWNQEQAVNGFFSGGGGPTASSSAKPNLNKLFDKYREDVTNNPDGIAIEGTMKYHSDLDISLEDIISLGLHEIVQAPAIGELSREGFVDGWNALGCDTVEKQKAYMKIFQKTLPTSKEAFTKVYKYTFLLAKTGNQKAIPLEVATVYWGLLFNSAYSAVKWKTPTSPWVDWWEEFLTTSWKKSVNKDMWNETLKFAQMTLDDEAISFWNEESSWPSVIDDFVDWVKKNHRDSGTVEPMEE